MTNATNSGLILSPGEAGHCDDYRLGGAVVDYDAVSGVWRMWYYCRDRRFSRPAPATLGTGRIALAVSDDGVRWSRVTGLLELGSVFVPSDNADRFDCGHVGLTDVTRGAGEWLMWYFGGDTRVVETGMDWLGSVPGLKLRCGLARSADGLTWTRSPGASSSGALFEILADELYAAWPNVFHDGRRFVLHYSAPTLDLKLYRSRALASTDGVHWERLGDLHWVGDTPAYAVSGMVTRHVIINPICDGRRWLMAYTALDADHRRSVALAGSDDGLTWSSLFDAPVFSPGLSGNWDDFGVAVNRIVVVGDAIYLYYYGFRSLVAGDGPRGIGLAIAPLDRASAFVRYDAATK